MKFILNEHKKFILKEKFILTEAEEILEVESKVFENVKVKWDSTKQKLTQYMDYINKLSILRESKINLDTVTERVARLNKDSLNIKMFKEALRSFYETLQQVITNAENALNSAPESMKDRLAGDSGVKSRYNEVFEELLGAFQGDASDTNEAISIEDLNEFYQLLAEEKELEGAYPIVNVSLTPEAVKKFEGAQKNISTSLQRICSDITEIEKMSELFNKAAKDNPNNNKDFQAFRQLLQELPTMLDALESVDKLKTILNQVAELNNKLVNPSVKTVLDLMEKTLKDDKKAKEEEEAKEKARADLSATGSETNDTNWSIRYANATNKEAIITEFIYTTWNTTEKGTKVEQIKVPLTKECEIYGFKASNDQGKNGNPFIKFISDRYLGYSEFKPETYNVIHNLVADNTIPAAELISGGSLQTANILFCKALYSLDYTVAKMYLQKQQALLKITKIPAAFKSIPEMVYNILYKLDDITSLTSDSSSVDLQLRSISTIEELEAKWIGEVTKNYSSKNDPTTNVTVDDKLLQQIETSENAVKVLVAMAVKFSSNKEITRIVKTCTEANELMSKTTTLEEVQRLVSKVESLYKLENIDKTKALDLVKKIMMSDLFKLTEI